MISYPLYYISHIYILLDFNILRLLIIIQRIIDIIKIGLFFLKLEAWLDSCLLLLLRKLITKYEDGFNNFYY